VQMTDCESDRVEIGMSFRMTFRKITKATASRIISGKHDRWISSPELLAISCELLAGRLRFLREK